MDEGWIRITPELSIPVTEIAYRASRSSGPGGQHANTSSTRVELVWDVGTSSALTLEQRDRILEKLASRLTGEGVLILASEATRSQHRNREDVTSRFAEMLREALHVRKARKKTRPTRASRERRLQTKKQRSERKKLRGPITFD
jgi:ribosome-associated protein